MIRINDPCDGVAEATAVHPRRTTIAQPEAPLDDRPRDRVHEQVRDVPFPYEQFRPITVAHKRDLPPEYEPLKRYID